jgi:hypothetical protein
MYMLSMKLNTRMIQWAAMTAMALATTASAQKEQWLDYHASRDGRGYRYLNLTTTPPPNVKLPKLNAQPYFAHWTTPLDPAGRWLCLDRTKKSGLHDRVYFDTTGNGRLDDKSPVGTVRTDQYSAYFEPVRVVFKGEDGPITYHLVLRFMKYDAGDANLLAASGGYYSGMVDLGGKKRRLELLDGNVNGAFNDLSANAYDCDRLTIEGDKTGERYLGKMFEADGQFYRIEVARDGAFVKLQKAEGLTFGTVHVPASISNFVAFGENGHFVRQPVKGEFTLPAGKYKILSWTINRKDAKGANWELMGNNFPDSAGFQADGAKPVTLKIAEPIRASLSASESTNAVAYGLNFQGQAGESIQIEKDNTRPPGPKLTLVSLNGTYRSTNTFEFG